jgi:hypothetical protein
MCNQAGAYLSALIESTDEFIWAVDLDYRLTTSNSALRNYVEITLASTLGWECASTTRSASSSVDTSRDGVLQQVSESPFS